MMVLAGSMTRRYEIRNGRASGFSANVNDNRNARSHNAPSLGEDVRNKWLAERLEETGRTASGLANAMGLAPARITEIVNGTRRIRIDELGVLSSYLQLPVEEVLTHLEVPLGSAPSGSVRIKIRGTVQAGNWHPAGEWQLPEEDWEAITVPKPNSYKGLFALQMAGTSMNQVYPEGSILIFTPIQEFRDLRSEAPWDHVLVIRKRHGEAEATVKELRIDKEGRQWLWPRSDDPQHQTPLELPSEGSDWPQDEEIEVAAVVVADYRRRA